MGVECPCYPWKGISHTAWLPGASWLYLPCYIPLPIQPPEWPFSTLPAKPLPSRACWVSSIGEGMHIDHWACRWKAQSCLKNCNGSIRLEWLEMTGARWPSTSPVSLCVVQCNRELYWKQVACSCWTPVGITRKFTLSLHSIKRPKEAKGLF